MLTAQPPRPPQPAHLAACPVTRPPPVAVAGQVPRAQAVGAVGLAAALPARGGAVAAEQRASPRTCAARVPRRLAGRQEEQVFVSYFALVLLTGHRAVSKLSSPRKPSKTQLREVCLDHKSRGVFLMFPSPRVCNATHTPSHSCSTIPPTRATRLRHQCWTRAPAAR